MSKLLERIRAAAGRHHTTLGFAGARDRETPSRPLLVLAEVDGVAGAAGAVVAGADALLYTGDAAGLAAAVTAGAALPVGARVTGATAAQVDALADAGADFLVFDDETTDAAALIGDRVGYVLALRGNGAAEPDREYLDALQPLELDALLVESRPERLTVREQLRTRRIGRLTRKSLILPVAAAVPSESLEVWRDAGTVAVLATGAAADPPVLARLVAAADEVPPPRERSRERADARVPSLVRGFDDDEQGF